VAAREAGDVFVNVQGDEPLLDPRAIDVAVNSLLEEPPACASSTVATPIKLPATSWTERGEDRSGLRRNALYFSRAPDSLGAGYSEQKFKTDHLKHLGLYVFQREALLEYARCGWRVWNNRSSSN